MNIFLASDFSLKKRFLENVFFYDSFLKRIKFLKKHFKYLLNSGKYFSKEDG